MTALKAFSIAWLPKEGEKIKREGYLYNHYSDSYLDLELSEEFIKFDLGGFKALGMFGYEYGLKKSSSVYGDFVLRHEFHRLAIGVGRSRTDVSLRDTSLDFEIGIKKQLLNTLRQHTNDVVTVLLGIAPGSTYILSSDKKRLFSHNNSYLIAGVSYGRSFFSRYNGFTEVSILDKIFFHDKLNELLINASIGLKSIDKVTFSLGVTATTGCMPYMSGSLENVNRKLKNDLQFLDKRNKFLEEELEEFLLPRKVKKKIDLYLNGSFNISEEKQIMLSLLTEMPLKKGVWGIKLEFTASKW